MAESKKNERIGEKRKANCGMWMEIVGYRTISDIDVRFSDGTVVEHKTYRSFLKGSVDPREANKPIGTSSHIGETIVNVDGQEVKLIAYKTYANIDVQFPDDSILCGKTYREFLAGKIRNPASFRKNEVRLSNSGVRMRVAGYRGSRKTDIEFEDGTILRDQEYSKFDSGKLSHPHLGHKTDKLFHGVKMCVVFSENDKTYYDCTFPDGTKDICTPQEIMERMGVPATF